MTTLVEISRKYTAGLPEEVSEKNEVIDRVKQYLDGKGWENMPTSGKINLSFFTPLTNLINKIIRDGKENLEDLTENAYNLNMFCADRTYDELQNKRGAKLVGMFESFAGNAAKAMLKLSKDPDWAYLWADCKQAAIDMRRTPSSLIFDYTSLSDALHKIFKKTGDMTDLDDSYIAISDALRAIGKKQWNGHIKVLERRLTIAKRGYREANDLEWAGRWYEAEIYRAENSNRLRDNKKRSSRWESAGDAAKAVAIQEDHEGLSNGMYDKAIQFYKEAKNFATRSQINYKRHATPRIEFKLAALCQ
jgi:hypothetical protein